MQSRRSFIAGLAAAIAAPAIVRAGLIMPVKPMRIVSAQDLINEALRQINPPLFGLSPAMEVLELLEYHNGIIRRMFVMPEEYLVR